MVDSVPGTIRICHLADLHLPLPVSPKPWQLLNKRFLGYLNLQIGRSRTHKVDPFKTLLTAIGHEEANLTLIAGDIANLALDPEYQAIDQLLLSAGLVPEKTLLIPGNHDRYTPIADLGESFERGMARWLPAGFSRRQHGYPFSRNLGPVEIIALDTAIWRGPLRAAGRVDREQISRLLDLLDRVTDAGRWPVIAMHHPPYRLVDEPLHHYRTGLAGFEGFVHALAERRATVLHGHLHRLSRRRLGGLDVIGPPSASNDCGREKQQLAYLVYTFGQQGLVDAQIVRHWPAIPGKPALERSPLPELVE